MNLPWVEKIRRADRDNTIDVYISDDHEDVRAGKHLADEAVCMLYLPDRTFLGSVQFGQIFPQV